MTLRLVPTMAVAVAAAAAAVDLGAQQVLAVDLGSGRQILADDTLGLHGTARRLLVDHVRGLLYAESATERDGVAVFSLETGQWLRTLAAMRGGGPQELPQGLLGWTTRAEGGVYLADTRRVLEVDSTGAFVRYWQPEAPERIAVCELSGRPAVPAQFGIVMRGPEGADDIWLGPEVVKSSTLVLSEEELRRPRSALDQFVENHLRPIACTDDAAFVVSVNETGPDSVYAYGLDGSARVVPVPVDDMDLDPVWNRRLVPKTDGRGHLLLVGPRRGVVGALIDPSSGCYAILRSLLPSSYLADREETGTPQFVDIYADSALVTYFPYENGTTYIGGEIWAMKLHPIRRLSGEPCENMLPSVEPKDGA